jgi:thiamine-phosphate pyrophosphorylase
LGQGDLQLGVAREIVGPATLLGLSTHDSGQVAAAAVSEADYFCVGPCWPTPTKPGRPAPGLQLVRAAAQLVSDLGSDKPWFAIGGIDAQRLPDVLEAGARRVVVVRAITAAEDPRAAAQQLRSALAAAS